MLEEMQRIQEAIDEVKHENETLKDEKHIYHNQLSTLKNVNESQQKLINFLNENKQGNETPKSPSMYKKIETSILNQENNFSPISEDENEFQNTVELQTFEANEDKNSIESENSFESEGSFYL